MAGPRFDEVFNLKLSVVHSCEWPLWSRQIAIGYSRYGPEADSCSTEKAPPRHMPDRRCIAMNHVQPAALGFADLTPLFP